MDNRRSATETSRPHNAAMAGGQKIEAKLGRVASTEQALVVDALLDVQAAATIPTIPF